MVPVRAPIIDYENPCYCPSSLQFYSIGVSKSDVDLRVSPFSRKDTSAAQARAHNYKGVKIRKYDQPGTSLSSIHALVYGRIRIADDFCEERRIPGRKWTSNDSSPCARYLPSFDERHPIQKRPRHTSLENKSRQNSLMVSYGGWNEPCGVKQEYPPPILRGEEEEQIYETPMKRFEKTPASAPECDVEDKVTTRTLLLRLDQLFPRMGFREVVDSAEQMWPETNAQYRYECHQALVDLLGEKGALNEYALTALNDAEFRHLNLGPTMNGVNELDLPQGDILSAFGQPGWFKHLRMLSFAGGRFRDDFDLTYIYPLRQIDKLILANTGIGNEGVFHIVALKHNLRYLDLSGNPSIDDDSMPALILLKNLQYLSLFGTGILMPGLRKLAVALKAGERAMDIKIPSTCREYINGMHTQYLLRPAPPLISDPDIVCMLSDMALSRNLEAHAAINPTVVCTGSHEEMEERLWRILEARKLDLVVREVLVDQEVRDGFE